jgi:probable rRNA maturation factor
MFEFIEDDEIESIDDEEFIDEELPLGDIVISMERTKEQAIEYNHSFERELAFLLVHGMLHLLGFDHENEKDEKIMFEKQENVLKMLNIIR